MSREALGVFYSQVLNDQALQERLKGEGQRSEFVERVVALGRERGFEFTAAEVEAELARNSASELSESELRAVAGGLQYSQTFVLSPDTAKTYA